VRKWKMCEVDTRRQILLKDVHTVRIDGSTIHCILFYQASTRIARILKFTVSVCSEIFVSKGYDLRECMTLSFAHFDRI
jgi:hypothetical protein